MSEIKHHVTYLEADKLRDVVTEFCPGPGCDGWKRISAARIGHTSEDHRQPHCRECGGKLEPNERAISFLFYYEKESDKPEYGPDPVESWLHLDHCPVKRYKPHRKEKQKWVVV